MQIKAFKNPITINNNDKANIFAIILKGHYDIVGQQPLLLQQLLQLPPPLQQPQLLPPPPQPLQQPLLLPPPLQRKISKKQ